jgi:phage baseplate assembly protein W
MPVLSQNTSRAFKDISLSFEPNPVTQDLPVIKNENAIKRSIRNLIETNLSERFFNSTLGSSIRSSLFDFVDIGSAANIQKQIEFTISNYEPRVDNVIVDVNPLPDTNQFDVNIFFDIIGKDFPTQEFKFLLEANR